MNTPDDFVQVLRENDEFRATMRRELLTEELLKVPDRLVTMEKSVDALLKHAEVTNRRLDHLEKGLKEVSRDIDGLGNSFREEIRAQSSFRGNYAQRAATGETIHIASAFAGLHGMERIKTRRVTRVTAVRWLEDNYDVVEALGLRARSWATFQVADVIAEARNLRTPDDAEPEFYIAVEASYTVETEDVVRATDHAKILRAVTGLDVYPVVSAVRLDDGLDQEVSVRLYEDVERFVEAGDEDAAYWYRLDSADLRPAEPR